LGAAQVPLHALQTARVEFEPALPDSKVRAIHGLAMATQIRVMLRCALPRPLHSDTEDATAMVLAGGELTRWLVSATPARSF
jgi:hypothetical protein